MFNNISAKIKLLAQISCWVGIVASFLYGVYIMRTTRELIVVGFIVGILVMVIGAFASWAGSFMTYGIGQLIENTDTLIKLKKIQLGEAPEETVTRPVKDDKEEKKDYFCSKCGKPLDPSTGLCPVCDIPEGHWRCMGCGEILPNDKTKCDCGYKR